MSELEQLRAYRTRLERLINQCDTAIEKAVNLELSAASGKSAYALAEIRVANWDGFKTTKTTQRLKI